MKSKSKKIKHDKNCEDLYTSPEEGEAIFDEIEKIGYENLPLVNFDIKIDPKKYKNSPRSIRLSDYILEGYNQLAKQYKIKPQTLMKAVLEEYLNKNLSGNGIKN